MDRPASASADPETSQAARSLPPAPTPSSPTAPQLPKELVDHILHLSAISDRLEYYAALLPLQSWRYTSHPPLSASHVSKLCLLSWSYNDAFTTVLYRSVVLDDDRAMARFLTTITANPRLGRSVRHLAIVAQEHLRGPASLLGQRRGQNPSPAYAFRRFLPTTSPADRLGLATTSRDEPTEVQGEAVADRILKHCPHATHILLSRSQFLDWSAGLYSLSSVREITLLGIGRGSELDGLVSRHRQNMTAALQNNPTIQALLNVTRSTERDVAETGEAEGRSRAASNNRPARGPVQPSASTAQGESVSATEGPPAFESTSSSSGSSGSSDPRGPNRSTGARLPLTHLHLINFDGRLVHHLAQLTSLTHIVLSYPRRFASVSQEEGPLLPRSHLLLLLGSGRIRRIVIRASPSICHQIMEKISPIRDERLIFRSIKLRRSRRSIASPQPPRSWNTSTSSGTSSSRSSNESGVQEVDLMAEWWERIHLDAIHHRRGDRATAWASSSSSRERGDSLSSSEPEADSSWSDDRDRGSSGETGSGSGSGSYDSEIYSDDEAESYFEEYRPWPPGLSSGRSPLPQHLEEQPLHQYRHQHQHRQQEETVATEAATHGVREPAPSFGAAGPSNAAGSPMLSLPGSTTEGRPMPAQAAPPPQIPIEQLLQYEDLEQVRQRRDIGLMGGPVARQRVARRSDEERRRIRPGAFAARRSDLRGATEEGMERLAEMLARQAAEGRLDDGDVGHDYEDGDDMDEE